MHVDVSRMGRKYVWETRAHMEGRVKRNTSLVERERKAHGSFASRKASPRGE